MDCKDNPGVNFKINKNTKFADNYTFSEYELLSNKPCLKPTSRIGHVFECKSMTSMIAVSTLNSDVYEPSPNDELDDTMDAAVMGLQSSALHALVQLKVACKKLLKSHFISSHLLNRALKFWPKSD